MYERTLWLITILVAFLPFVAKRQSSTPDFIVYAPMKQTGVLSLLRFDHTNPTVLYVNPQAVIISIHLVR